MIRFLAILVGIAFIVSGVAGYGMLPQLQLVKEGLLLGYFEIDMMHNLLHIVTGVLAIMSATSFKLSKLFFILFGFLYGIAAGVGFWRHGDMYMLHVNMVENYLHAGVGLLFLFIALSAEKNKAI